MAPDGEGDAPAPRRSHSTLTRIPARAGRGAGHAWTLLSKSVEGLFRHRGTQLAASISYYAFLSLFPAAIVFVAGFGLLFGDSEARTSVVDFLTENLPVTEGEGRSDLEGAVDGVTQSSGTVGLIGLAALLISASALMGAIRNALGVVFADEYRRPPLRGKALDVLFVVGLGVLIGLSLAMTIISGLAIDVAGTLAAFGDAVEWALNAIGALLPLGLSLVVFAIVLRVIPASVHRIRDVWPGVIFATLGYELAKRGFTLYLENFANYSAVYGSLGAAIAFLVFVYVGALLFLLGAEIAALWPAVRAGDLDAPDTDGEPFGRQVRDFLRGLVFDTKARRTTGDGDGGATPSPADAERGATRDTVRSGGTDE